MHASPKHAPEPSPEIHQRKRNCTKTLHNSLFSKTGKAMEEGGERTWRLAVGFRRKEQQLVLEFLCFLPRVQPEAPEAHKRLT